jgi:hypothetical protein
MPARREEAFNVRLSDLLNHHGLTASAETIQHGGRRVTDLPDILVDWTGLRVAVEAKFDMSASARDEVVRQARQRLDDGFGAVTAAILYPTSIRTLADTDIPAALETADLQVRLFAPPDRDSDWNPAEGAAGLAAILDRAREQLASTNAINDAADQLRETIEMFARAMHSQPARRDQLFQKVSVADATATGSERETALEAAIRIGGLALCTAVLLQHRLSEVDASIPPVPSPGLSRSIRRALLDSWRQILHIDYSAVFQLASHVLKSVSNTAPMPAALQSILQTGDRISDGHVLGSHDLIGRVYHTLLADRKYLATYFTSVPAATLLTNLALDRRLWPSINFAADAPDFDLRFGDLACGTGTLLSESMAVITSTWLTTRAESHLPADRNEIAKRLIEQNVWGFDILAYAVQICAATLLLACTGVSVDGTHLFQMPFGGTRGLLGSLEFLYTASTQGILFGDDAREAPRSVGLDVSEELSEIDLPQLDLVVMNPPFTRSVGGSKLLGSLPDAEFRTARDRLAALTRRPGVTGSLTAGLGSVFVDLAVRCVRDNGRLALVLPKTVLTGDTWEGTRALIADKFHVEYVIACHEAGRWNFSDSTKLSEVLIIARRLSAGESNTGRTTTWINLCRNPRTPIHALGVVAAIRHLPDLVTAGPQPIRVSERLFSDYGQASAHPAPRDGTPWRHAVFYDPALGEVAEALQTGEPIPLPRSSMTPTVSLVPLGTLGGFGPDVRDVHDGFSRSYGRSAYPAWWDHDANEVKWLKQTSNAYLTARSAPIPGRPLRRATDLWEGAGRLMVAERLRLNTQRCVSVALPEKALSNTWWPVHLNSDDPDDDRILAMWMNTTFGILLWNCSAEETDGPWVKMKKNKLRNLPVLDPSSLSRDQREALLATWDRFGEGDLRPIAQCERDTVRRRFDAAFCETLGIPEDPIDYLRRQFSAEPRLQRPITEAQVAARAADPQGSLF